MLCLQLKSITAFRLQYQFIQIFTKNMDVDWAAVPTNDAMHRAYALESIIKRLATFDQHRHSLLCAALGTIDTTARDSHETKVLEDEIAEEGELNAVYVYDDFDMQFQLGRKKKKDYKSRTPHNIITWIYIASHADAKDSLLKESAINGARRIWHRIASSAAVIAASQTPSTFFITEPTLADKTPEELKALFTKAYKDYKHTTTGIVDYPAAISYQPRIEFLRFSTNTLCSPHFTMQHVDKDFFDALEDKSADSFHLDYFPARGYIRISKVIDAQTTRAIATCFVEKALGAKIITNKGKRHQLSVFSSPSYKNKLKLSEEAQKRGEKVWISAITCAYYDQQGEVVSKNREFDFKWSEDHDIFSNIDGGKFACQLSQTDKPEYTREILDVELSFLLCDYENHGSRPLYYDAPMKKAIKIHIRPKSFDFLEKTKDLKPLQKEAIKNVLEQCDLMPKTADQINLSLGALNA